MSDKRPRIWPPVLLMVLGPIIGIASFAVLVAGAISTVTSPSFDLPGSATRTLDKGVYLVYERIGESSSSDNVTITRNKAVTIGPEDVEVTGPGGTRIPTRVFTGDEKLTRNTSVFAAAVKFTVETPGQYDVKVSAGDGVALVGPSLTDSVRKHAGWLGGIALGGLAFLLGLIWLIVALRRRSKMKAALVGAYPAAAYGYPPTAGYPAAPPSYPPAPSAPPIQDAAAPGWYPDSERPGSQRYWDGTSWTEHRS